MLTLNWRTRTQLVAYMGLSFLAFLVGVIITYSASQARIFREFTQSLSAAVLAAAILISAIVGYSLYNSLSRLTNQIAEASQQLDASVRQFSSGATSPTRAWSKSPCLSPDRPGDRNAVRQVESTSRNLSGLEQATRK